LITVIVQYITVHVLPGLRQGNLSLQAKGAALQKERDAAFDRAAEIARSVEDFQASSAHLERRLRAAESETAMLREENTRLNEEREDLEKKPPVGRGALESSVYKQIAQDGSLGDIVAELQIKLTKLTVEYEVVVQRAAELEESAESHTALSERLEQGLEAAQTEVVRLRNDKSRVESVAERLEEEHEELRRATRKASREQAEAPRKAGVAARIVAVEQREKEKCVVLETVCQELHSDLRQAKTEHQETQTRTAKEESEIKARHDAVVRELADREVELLEARARTTATGMQMPSSATGPADFGREALHAADKGVLVEKGQREAEILKHQPGFDLADRLLDRPERDRERGWTAARVVEYTMLLEQAEGSSSEGWDGPMVESFAFLAAEAGEGMPVGGWTASTLEELRALRQEANANEKGSGTDVCRHVGDCCWGAALLRRFAVLHERVWDCGWDVAKLQTFAGLVGEAEEAGGRWDSALLGRFADLVQETKAAALLDGGWNAVRQWQLVDRRSPMLAALAACDDPPEPFAAANPAASSAAEGLLPLLEAKDDKIRKLQEELAEHRQASTRTLALCEAAQLAVAEEASRCSGEVVKDEDLESALTICDGYLMQLQDSQVQIGHLEAASRQDSLKIDKIEEELERTRGLLQRERARQDSIASGLEAVWRDPDVPESSAQEERMRNAAREEFAELIHELDQDRWLLWGELKSRGQEEGRVRGAKLLVTPPRWNAYAGLVGDPPPPLGVERMRRPESPSKSLCAQTETVDLIHATHEGTERAASEWQIRPGVSQMAAVDRQRALADRGPTATVLAAPRRVLHL